jgi:hypothetical protein
MKRNKRANTALDVLIFVIIAIVFGIAMPNISEVREELNDVVQDSDMSARAKLISQQSYEKVNPTIDSIFVLFFFVSWIFMLISAFIIQSHPVFFWISLVAFILVLMVTVYLANDRHDLIYDTDLELYAQRQPMTSFVLNNLLVVVVVMITSTALVLHFKGRGGIFG